MRSSKNLQMKKNAIFFDALYTRLTVSYSKIDWRFLVSSGFRMMHLWIFQMIGRTTARLLRSRSILTCTHTTSSLIRRKEENSPARRRKEWTPTRTETRQRRRMIAAKRKMAGLASVTPLHCWGMSERGEGKHRKGPDDNCQELWYYRIGN